MMHALRPVRASASKLLSTPIGTNSTVDYQQAHVLPPSESGGGFVRTNSGRIFVAVQQPCATGLASPQQAFSDGWNNVANLPVIWPMHSVFNDESGTAGCTQNDGPGLSGDALTVEKPMPTAPQNQVEMSPQTPNCLVAGSMIWMQPVLWPAFRTYDGMQVFGMAPCGDVGMPSQDASTGLSHQGGGPSSVPELPLATPTPSDAAAEADGRCLTRHAEKPHHATGGASGLRPPRQRRSKRGPGQTVTRRAAAAALCPEELEELRRAVRSTEQALEVRSTEQALEVRHVEEACAKSPSKCVDAERHSNLPKQSRASSKTKVRWADALEEEEEGEVASEVSMQVSLAASSDQGGASQRELSNIVVKPCSEVGNINPAQELDFAEDSLSPEAAVDPVLLELDNADGANFRSTMDWVVSSVWPLALTKRGCRIVQKSLDVGSSEDQYAIVEKLQGRVNEAMRSPHANHVLQKCIEIMPSGQMHFVLAELQGEGAFAARHRFGCRILQRLIEHCPTWQTEPLVSEVLLDTSRLCRHQYGNFVIQHILQYGSSPHRRAIAEVLCEDTIRLAKHRIASHVLSCAMVHCETEDVQRLTKVVLSDAGQLADLSRRQYGSFVVREVNRATRLLDASLQQ